MKRTEKKEIGKKILNGSLSFAKGMIGGVNPVIGAVVGAGEGVINEIQKEKENNLNSEIGGIGKIDIARLSGLVVFVGLVGLFIAGLITIEDLKELIKIFLKTQ